MTIYEVLKTMDIPVAYGTFKEKVEPPFMVYLGNGQGQFKADNKPYYRQNLYRVEYYYKLKNEALEAKLEAVLTNENFNYDKSSDAYIESEDLYIIYYDVWRYE